MSEPWEFDTEAKTLAGFVAAFILIGFVSVRIDMNSRGFDQAREHVQIACLQAGHSALECKELR